MLTRLSIGFAAAKLRKNCRNAKEKRDYFPFLFFVAALWFLLSASLAKIWSAPNKNLALTF
jgi:hypothetical protein